MKNIEVKTTVIEVIYVKDITGKALDMTLDFKRGAVQLSITDDESRRIMYLGKGAAKRAGRFLIKSAKKL